MTAPSRARPDAIEITEVGPRDGLQNEPATVPTEAKATLIRLLAQAGVRSIEATSFVSPKWVPQLADAETLLAALPPLPNVRLSVLVPNERGLERALAVQRGTTIALESVAVFAAASETFSRRNVNATIAETMERFAPVVNAAHASGVRVRGYVSCAVACPFEGPIAPAAVRDVSARLLDLGVDEIDLGDTIGVAVPGDIEALLAAHDGLVAIEEIVLHLHDTRGTALACAWAAMRLGVRRFDASCGGVGGCPYAPGAAGNLATEDLVYLCRQCGIETGIDLDALVVASRHLAAALGRTLPSRVLAAGGCAVPVAAAGEAADGGQSTDGSGRLSTSAPRS